MSMPQHETRRDVEAALAARGELGPDYDEHIAAGLAERIEQLAAYRTAELRQQTERVRAVDAVSQRGQTQRFVLGIISLGAGIPITAITIVQGTLIETVIAWAGIVGVNAVHAWGSRRDR
ncbi:hypothetical protein GCM10009841_34060 [Microlunatus panaciterrae]|uniref:DUF1707 domain-containing protein n=1 Tax=Microlunatus panaciterrae TaxID=400768 RepID=A0ABS2RGC8_9ACTN|nr:hypothetical protein [Microlunatus panaciterrae]MBM7798065.1 hypothetical protein [Microlunatus panaciterrae]